MFEHVLLVCMYTCSTTVSILTFVSSLVLHYLRGIITGSFQLAQALKETYLFTCTLYSAYVAEMCSQKNRLSVYIQRQLSRVVILIQNFRKSAVKARACVERTCPLVN
jgi:hypothetical protein